MAGTCEPTWVGFKDNSEIAGDLGVRNMNFGGGGGIRTLGTVLPVHGISSAAPSSTRTPLHSGKYFSKYMAVSK